MNKEQNPFNEKDDWTVGEFLKAVSGPDYPEFILAAVQQIQKWLSTFSETEQLEEEGGWSGDRRYLHDPERLFSSLEGITSWADLIPDLQASSPKEEALVLCLAPMEFEDGLRLAIDHASLFGRGRCKRVWFLSDTWVTADLQFYGAHFKTLAKQGIEMRFLLVTPWGWSEIPVGKQYKPSGQLPWRKGNPF